MTAAESKVGTPVGALAQRIAVRYALPPGSTCVVSAGAQVARGDMLARAPRPPVLAAVAAELGVAQMSHITATIPAVGTAVQAGASLARRHRGVRTHVARAPVTGTIAETHPLGVVILAPDGAVADVRARCAGTIVSMDEGGIVIATSTTHLPYTYGLNLALRDFSLVVDESLLTGALTTRTPLPPVPSDAALVVAHIGDLRTLAAARQRAGALLLIGSVADAVAWELCTSAADATAADGAAILVLAGPGDADTGARAVAPLRTHNGARAMIDGEARTLILLDEGDPAETSASAVSDGRTIFFHEPAYWGESGTITGDVREHALESGLRVLAVETTSTRRGAAATPIQNFGKSA